MPLDALSLAAIRQDLETKIIQARCERIFQPGRGDLLFLLRKGAEQYRLYFSADTPCPWLGLADSLPGNPANPPAFCMLLRKYLAGGRILRLTQPPYERLVSLGVEHYDELTGLSERTLHLELMGRRGNAVLVDPDGMILDALWRTPEESARPLLPGIPYQAPPAGNRLNPETIAEGTFRNLLAYAPPRTTVAKILQEKLLGLAPTTVAGLLDQAGLASGRLACDLSEPEVAALWTALARLAGRVRSGDLAAQAIFDPDGRAVEISAFPNPCAAGHAQVPIREPAAEAGRIYMRIAAGERVARRRNELLAKVRADQARARRKYQKQLEEAAAAGQADVFREYGDLLLANLHLVPRGADAVELASFLDPNRKIVVDLDRALSPSANAQAYFRRYQRAKRGQMAIAAQLARTEDTLHYLDQLAYSLAAAETESELAEIAAEMAAEGLLPKAKTAAVKQSGPRRYVSLEGVEILVGRNNRQNEHLTFGVAEPADTWLHTRQIPGAHVIIKQGKAAGVSDATLIDAANLAVYYSQARRGTKVPVDYTQRRHVRKRPGGHPGLVNYDRFQTVIVDPDQEILTRLLRQKDLADPPRRSLP
ncbi:MAG: NFACT family protein [Bacteroidota bacterium]